MLQELIAEIDDGLEHVSEAVKRGELRLDGAKVVIVFPFDHYRTQLLAPRWGIRGRRSGVVQPNPRH